MSQAAAAYFAAAAAAACFATACDITLFRQRIFAADAAFIRQSPPIFRAYIYALMPLILCSPLRYFAMLYATVRYYADAAMALHTPLIRQRHSLLMAITDATHSKECRHGVCRARSCQRLRHDTDRLPERLLLRCCYAARYAMLYADAISMLPERARERDMRHLTPLIVTACFTTRAADTLMRHAILCFTPDATMPPALIDGAVVADVDVSVAALAT